MAQLNVVNHLSLDGVMQSPARPDEDPRDGFAHGGWAMQNADDVMGRELGQRMGGPGALLLGRQTYEDFSKVWPARTDGNPYTEALNASQKYVASRTLAEPLPWQNSTLLTGDTRRAVRALKAEVDGSITVLGSGDLLQTLIRERLVDEYVLLIHPLVLGSGRRMFPSDGARAALEVVSSVTTPTGVIIATYRDPQAAR